MNIQDLLGPGAQSTQNTKGVGQKELGQGDFLKLLVAQMQNQDPSNPSDNSQFLSQIAQFSMVDGIDGLGESFDGIAGNLFSSQAMSASQLVGREVLSDSGSGWLQADRPIEGVIGIPEYTDGVNIQVRDSSGRLVKTLDSAQFKAGFNPFTWNGLNEQGEMQPAGEYTVSATGLIDGKSEALPVQFYNTVDSITVSRAGSQVALQLDNNVSVSFTGITQYR